MRNLILIFLLFSTFACSEPSLEVKRGIYFWENDTESFSTGNRAALDSLKIEKIYIKVFEVDRIKGTNKPIAKSSLQLDPASLENREVIPCIYLLNKVFIESSKKELDDLADNVVHLTQKFLTEKLGDRTKIPFSEIQLDCDWSEKSQGNYFYFIRKVKERSKKQISCTLRLYPYKFHQKMGIPPCDRAVLMCYNLLSPLKNPRKNTILDTEEMAKYLDTKFDYPIPLDVALPVYSWMQCYDGTRFKGIVKGPVEPYKELLLHTEGLWYYMKSDTVLVDVYLRQGDRIKLERVSERELSKAIEIIKSSGVLKNDAVFSYFHLSSQELNHYSYETLNSYSSRLSN